METLNTMSAKRRKTKVKLGYFLSLYRTEHIVEDDKTYRQVTISKKHGISFRGAKYGKNIGRKRQFILDLKRYPNTVMFTRQGVFDGAIGIAPTELDKCIVTENMPMMSVNVDMVEISYLKKLLVSDYLHDKIQSLKIVGSAQKSIHERDLLNISITLPDKKAQKKICNKFDALDVEHSELEKEITHQQTLLKKLRQQILQEAIEGKLTAEWRQQNPNVEPANELLSRIQAEKEQLIKDRKIKKQKPLPPISNEEKPFDLADGWVWCRLGDISINSLGKMLDAQKNKGELKPYIRNLNIQWYRVNVDNLNMMPFESHETDKYSVKYGDILICEGGYPGQAAIWTRDEQIMFQKALHRVRFILQCFPSKLFVHLLWLWDSNGEIRKHFTGSGIQHLTGKSLNKILIPLPPLPEQKAIATKVEKLLALCDQMEIQITTSQTHAKQLMQAVLKEAFSPNSEELLAG